MVVPANAKAQSTTVLINVDLLTETKPDSEIFARQTVLDTVSIAFAKPGSQSVLQLPN